MDQGVIFIGMDLGTFKTSIASSTGLRDVMHSAVGWPKDYVARTLHRPRRGVRRRTDPAPPGA